MELILQRYSDNRQSTLGLMFKKATGKPFFMAYTIEDEHRDVKVMGETRIPAAKYKLAIQKTETPLTVKYRAKYPWFKNHIEITNVPGFVGVYIHIGNTDLDSAGCVLLGDNADNNQIGGGAISNSTQAFKRFYSEVYDLLESKNEVTLEIRDEIKLC